MGGKEKKGADSKIRSWLIGIREDRAMTQGAVAAAAGIAQPSYYEIEKGITNPKPQTAMAIAQVLGFPWTMFYEEKKSDNVDAFDAD